MIRRVGLLTLTIAAGCHDPCTPDLHPAVVVEMPGRDCGDGLLLFMQPDARSVRCEVFADEGGCVGWCARADRIGVAVVRLQTDERAYDVALELPTEACPVGPLAEAVIPPPE